MNCKHSVKIEINHYKMLMGSLNTKENEDLNNGNCQEYVRKVKN